VNLKPNKYYDKGYKTVEAFLSDDEFRKEFIRTEVATENEAPRDYIRASGLLTIAKALDIIKVMNTQLIHAPGPTNDWLAIAHCTLELKDGCIFTGIGDSDGKNTVAPIDKHRCRVAETRADARALRKALGITILAVEEMEKIGPTIDDSPITEKQIQFIGSLIGQKGLTKDRARELAQKTCGKSGIVELTKNEASALIEAFKALPNQ